MWVNAVATEGMLGDLNPLGDGPCRSLADHGARVPEELPAVELEGFLNKKTEGTVHTKHQELKQASNQASKQTPPVKHASRQGSNRRCPGWRDVYY